MILVDLLISFFQVGLFSFGGGYAALPLIQEQIIYKRGWMTAQEFVDVLTLSEMTPGPIAINAATFVGNRVAGIPGGIVATIGVTLPSVFIVLLLATLYFKFQNLSLVQGVIQGLRPAVVALIGSAGLSIFLTALFGEGKFPIEFSQINWISVLLFSISIGLLRKTRFGPIQIMLFSGVAGLLIYTLI
ncbi:chromate transporter [Lacticigenium naphthae]|uniref:chromate transporter n=1 Tax=Lacticigenium naphthae TaxID=515351 RepID=UPI000419334F|nr:chromate transporter [Lacticigenium naphthae]